VATKSGANFTNPILFNELTLSRGLAMLRDEQGSRLAGIKKGGVTPPFFILEQKKLTRPSGPVPWTRP